MNNLNFDEPIAMKTSCNKEDAVAKLLGWLQSPACQDLTETENGYSLQQLKYMDTLVYTLAEHLTDLRTQALWKTDDLIDAKASEENIDKAVNDVLDIEDLMKKAHLFLIEIEDELSKGEFSVLKVDAESTSKNNDIHITLKSLDTWGRKKFNQPVLDSVSTKLMKYEEKVPLLKQQERAILGSLIKLKLNAKSLPPYISGKPGAKANVRKDLAKNPLFFGTQIYDKAWKRLSDSGLIVYES